MRDNNMNLVVLQSPVPLAEFNSSAPSILLGLTSLQCCHTFNLSFRSTFPFLLSTTDHKS
jgi:hypothetical protein